MKILVLDNYDSFTYNLVYLIKHLGYTLDVFRNDKILIEDVEHYDKILLSPGPGLPKDAGIMPKLIERYAKSKSILGVCLGHQAIGEAFGASLHNLEEVKHGVYTHVLCDPNKDMLFSGLPPKIKAAQYHSWIIDKQNLPDGLIITAENEMGLIMAIRHRIWDVVGFQFHPESIMTEFGEKLILNWLNS